MINNLKAHAESFWSFDMLDEALPGREGFSDIDGITEKFGHFLVLEFKAENAKVSGGQAYLFDALVRLEEFNVIVVWGPKDDPQRAMVWGHHESPVQCNEETLKSWIRQWRRKAGKKRG